MPVSNEKCKAIARDVVKKFSDNGLTVAESQIVLGLIKAAYDKAAMISTPALQDILAQIPLPPGTPGGKPESDL